MKPYILYIDIASIINDTDKSMELNSVRKQQIINGVKKILEFDFKKYNCDIMLSDNTTETLWPELIEILSHDTIIQCFKDNRFGSVNKGAGLVQKWLYNQDTLKNYEWVIHFEGRLLLQSFYFLETFFNNPAYYFRYGDPMKIDTTAFFTGLFSVRTTDLFEFCKEYTIDRLISGKISIEYPMKEFMFKKTTVLDHLDLIWFCARSKPYIF